MYTIGTRANETIAEIRYLMDCIEDEIKVRRILAVNPDYMNQLALKYLIRVIKNRRTNYKKILWQPIHEDSLT